MMAIADIHGWRKMVTAPDHCLQAGFFKMMIQSPLSNLVYPYKDTVMSKDMTVKTIVMEFTGEYQDHLPIFSYRHK